MKIGDIHWVDLPTNGGREQQGPRPAIVVQDENYGGRLPTVFVIPLSSTRNALRFAGTALIAANLTGGLRNDSTALVFQCRAIDRKRIGERIGSITIDERQEVFAEWRKLTGQKADSERLTKPP